MFHPCRRALTLLELLLVLAGIALLVGLLIPAIQSVRSAASRLRCASNLRQIGLALQQHHDATQVFPSNGGWDGHQSILASNGASIHTTVLESTFSLLFTWGVGVPALSPQEQTGSWAYAILPYVEQQMIHDDRIWTSPVALYLCPGRSRPGPCQR